MPSVPDNEPHPRLASWLVAGAVVVAVAALLAASAWFLVPVIAPAFTLNHSPFAAPAFRAAAALRPGGLAIQSLFLRAWMGDDPARQARLLDYLGSSRERERLMAAIAFAADGPNTTGKGDAVLLDLLHSPSPATRCLAVEYLFHPKYIPELEKLGIDPDNQAASEIANKLEMLRLRAQ